MILIKVESNIVSQGLFASYRNGHTVKLTLRSIDSIITFETTGEKADLLLKMTHDRIEKLFSEFEGSMS